VSWVLRTAALEAIIAHARASRPRECCGLLLGGNGRILEAVATRNLAESDTRFLVDPQGHIDARRAARARGLEVVGFYHSHPHSAAVPSPTDLAEAAYPRHLYLIVGLGGATPDVRLFWLDEGRFQSIEFDTDSGGRGSGIRD
jgi:proteasome lid subunit RPN8/RPN11